MWQDLYVLENAKQKALEVLRRQAEGAEHAVVIGCDTVVVLDGVILEKPKDEDDAFRMLSSLAGRAHDVYSGVALLTPALGELKPHLFFERTAVAFGPLEPQDIRGGSQHGRHGLVAFFGLTNAPLWRTLAYIATGEPMDKAGAYGLQGGFQYMLSVCIFAFAVMLMLYLLRTQAAPSASCERSTGATTTLLASPCSAFARSSSSSRLMAHSRIVLVALVEVIAEAD